ncbi:MAG TPA: choice-of-anchor D domain-containing protein, partial [Polyangia bacterium]
NTKSGGVTFTLRNDGQEDAAGLAAVLTGADKDEFALTNSCTATLRSEQSCSLVVTYEPKDTGVSTAALSVTSTNGGTVTATLGGTGVPPAAISITPNTQDFGSIGVGGSSAAINFTIRNTGGTPSGNLAVSTVGTEFRLPADANGCSNVSLPANGTCTVSVIFSPTSAGAKSSNLTVITEAVGTTSASLIGTAVAPAALAIRPVSGNFGSVGAGGASNELTFTVSNTGGAATGVVTVAPNSTQFKLSSNGCPNKSLGINESCDVGVRFEPSTTGDFSAKLIAMASPGGSASADLTGAGTTPPSLVFFFGSTAETVHAFGSSNVGVATAPVQLTLRNTSAVPTGMLATTLQGANAGDFVIVPNSNTCGAPLPGGGQCTLSVLFNPTAAGDRSAVLNVMSASGGVGTILLTGSGTALLQVRRMGVALSTYAFGSVTAGLTVDETFEIYAVSASGTYTIGFDGGGSPPSFVRMGGTCDGTPLSAGTSCTVVIRFQPQYPKGDKTGSMTATTSAGVTATLALTGTSSGPLQLTPSPHNFGSLPAGTTAEQTFTLRNNGSLPMTSVAVALPVSDFSVVADTCALAPPAANGTCTITVRFVPTTAGPKTATLTATGTYTVAGADTTDVATVALSGVSTSAAAITVTPGNGTFEEAPVGGTPVTKTFTVTNAAGAPSTGPIIRTVSMGDFALTRNGCLLADNVTARPLGAGESCTFDVRLTPTAAGARTGTLTVSASPGGTVSVPLSGVGITGIALSLAQIDLDTTAAGAPVENVLAQVNPRRQVTVTNRTTAVATLTPTFEVSSALGATPDGKDYFTVVPDATAGATPCGATLAAGASCTYQIFMVTPGAPGMATPGTKKAVFQVTAGSATTTATAEVTGTMLRDANIVFLDSANRDFGGVVTGTSSASHLIQLRNTGGVKTGPLQMFDLANGFTRLPTTGTNPATGNSICTLGMPLNVNETCDILVQFAPTAAGAAMTTLKVYVTGPGQDSAGVSTTTNVRTLSGVGLTTVSAPLSPTPTDFGTAAAGAGVGVDRSVTLTNSTGGTLTIGVGDITLASG